LAFGLMVNDGVLDSPSNSVAYYHYSNSSLQRELNTNNLKLYQFNQVNSPKNTFFSIPLKQLQFHAFYSLKIRILLKLQTLLYQKIISFKTQYPFINKTITYTNSCEILYLS
jgi:hypothetical protein